MSISSSLNAGVSGLNANSNKLATISDNIANSQTAGYKRADADFASMVLSANARTYTAGGVRTTTVREVDAKGGIIGTTNATDLAIAGRGMFPVTSIANVNAGDPTFPLMLAPTGSFQPDANGILRTASGLVLLGWPADMYGNVGEPARDTVASLQPIRIDRAAVAAAPTGNVTLNANLPAAATLPSAELGITFPITVEYFDTLGASQSLTFSFEPVGDGQLPDERPVPNTWTLTITDKASVRSGNDGVMGRYAIVFDASRDFAGSIKSLEPIGDPAESASYDGETGIISLALQNGQDIAVRIGAENGERPQFLNQLASVFSPVGVTKDGSAAGTFAGVTVDENGFMSINYSSGFSRVIYKIPVADVPNMNGLKAMDNQAFMITNASGPVYFWDAGTGPVGSVMGFAMEQSTVDIARELTDLIQTQRAYSSNAKIIQTVDEMLQETTNLKR
jgi:flagellar hook protein FlgE